MDGGWTLQTVAWWRVEGDTWVVRWVEGKGLEPMRLVEQLRKSEREICEFQFKGKSERNNLNDVFGKRKKRWCGLPG